MLSPVQTSRRTQHGCLFFNGHASRIRKASAHFTLLIRLTGHLIGNSVVSRSIIRRSPEDRWAELAEGLCHRLLRRLLHPPNQSWFLISHSQVHREDTGPAVNPVRRSRGLGAALPARLPAAHIAVLCVMDCFQMCNGNTGILDQKDGQVKGLNLSSRTCTMPGAVTGMAFGGTDALWPQSHLSQGLHWAFPPAPVTKISSAETGLLSHLY